MTVEGRPARRISKRNFVKILPFVGLVSGMGAIYDGSRSVDNARARIGRSHPNYSVRELQNAKQAIANTERAAGRAYFNGEPIPSNLKAQRDEAQVELDRQAQYREALDRDGGEDKGLTESHVGTGVIIASIFGGALLNSLSRRRERPRQVRTSPSIKESM